MKRRGDIFFDNKVLADSYSINKSASNKLLNDHTVAQTAICTVKTSENTSTAKSSQNRYISTVLTTDSEHPESNIKNIKYHDQHKSTPIHHIFMLSIIMDIYIMYLVMFKSNHSNNTCVSSGYIRLDVYLKISVCLFWQNLGFPSFGIVNWFIQYLVPYITTIIWCIDGFFIYYLSLDDDCQNDNLGILMLIQCQIKLVTCGRYIFMFRSRVDHDYYGYEMKLQRYVAVINLFSWILGIVMLTTIWYDTNKCTDVSLWFNIVGISLCLYGARKPQKMKVDDFQGFGFLALFGLFCLSIYGIVVYSGLSSSCLYESSSLAMLWISIALLGLVCLFCLGGMRIEFAEDRDGNYPLHRCITIAPFIICNILGLVNWRKRDCNKRTEIFLHVSSICIGVLMIIGLVLIIRLYNGLIANYRIVRMYFIFFLCSILFVVSLGFYWYNNDVNRVCKESPFGKMLFSWLINNTFYLVCEFVVFWEIYKYRQIFREKKQVFGEKNKSLEKKNKYLVEKSKSSKHKFLPPDVFIDRYLYNKK